ncbi:tubulin binding protein [Bibersteinia trehalosi Y31]|uniref:Tubulin binding protein n=1 Tax=Bibersteinia trehalosi Y31 TaxID=1261658 RepID=A0A179D025_BIBTR|nr:translocation/assembly module TamB domain-containing protein [Bibersteinia trehalosi]OAQ15167.1 tubulin binding protein [Bibersteinia trehalosi Y31]
MQKEQNNDNPVVLSQAQHAESINHEQQKAIAPVRAKSKWRGLWCFLLLLLGLSLGILAFLVTGKGQRAALHFVTRWLDELSIESIEGSLQEGLYLRNAIYQMEGVGVKVGQANLHLGFDCLLTRKACIENLVLNDAEVIVETAKLSSSPTEKESTPIGEISLPLEVAVKNLELNNIQVRVDEMDITLAQFKTSALGVSKNIRIAPTVLDGLTLSLAPEVVENTREQVKEKAKEKVKSTDWTALKRQLAEPLLNKLEPIRLPLYFDLPKFEATHIQIEQKKRDDEGQLIEPVSILKVPFLGIQGNSNEQKVVLQHIDLQTDKGNVSGQGELTLSGNYPLHWHLKGWHPEIATLKIPASTADVDIQGELFGTTTLTIQSRGAAEFHLTGDIALSEAKTPFNLHLNSAQVQYPFMPEKGEKPLQLQKINLNLTGDLLDYRLQGSLDSRGMNLPAGSLQFDGHGDITYFSLKDFVLQALEGKANLVGKVDWTDGVEWESSVELDKVNTKSLLPEWAAVLSGKLTSNGYAARGEQNTWAVNVNDMAIYGNLFQKKLELKGDLSADSQTLLSVPQAELVYGENVIALKGVLGDKSDFSADINAPNLKGLVPHLAAGLKGKVKMQGKLVEPILELDLTANDVAYDTLKLHHLSAKGKVHTEKQINVDLNLVLNQFSRGEIKIDHANLTLQGTETNHNLKFTSKGEPVAGNLQLAGKFDRSQQIWQGALSNVSIQSPVGILQNDKAVQINYNNKQILANISAHCWHNPKLHLCFPQTFQAGEEGKVPFEIRQFDLVSVQEFLDNNTQLTGIVNAKGDAAWFKNKAPQVNLELSSNSLKLSQKLDSGAFPLAFAPVKVTAKMAENNLNVNTDIRIENNGRITSDMQMKDIANKRALSGSIHIDRVQLSLLKPLLSNGESVHGDINARLTVGGTALSPLLYGNLNLTGLKAQSNAMPFDVTGGGLTLNFNGASSTLKGNVQTPQSNLVLDGDANWQKVEAWYTRIRANANKFRVDLPGIAKVDISPNIEVKASPKELVLGGKIDIPWARIEVQELPESAVSVSSDEVIMDGSAKHKRSFKLPMSSKNAPQNGQGMAIKGDVAINIGNDVRLEAYGLKTHLNGTVKVRQGNRGLGLYGQVNLKNGTFASFGQDLVIRKGLISFAGLPSQPSVEIEAIRNPEAIEDQNVTAGVKVTGIADNLDVKLFSSPSMSQDEILSYILTGRGLESSGDAGSGNSIAAALIGLSLSKGSKTVGSVGSAFGINDLSVTTAGIGDNTKVVVSGSLTPKFRVKYGVGIFAPLTELTLRYRLAPSLYLQWVSSLNQAVDLLYRFEF